MLLDHEFNELIDCAIAKLEEDNSKQSCDALLEACFDAKLNRADRLELYNDWQRMVIDKIWAHTVSPEYCHERIALLKVFKRKG